MKVAVLGGGPAGLYFAISMKLRNSAHEVTVIERNKPDDTFGWGVVLSAETLSMVKPTELACCGGALLISTRAEASMVLPVAAFRWASTVQLTNPAPEPFMFGGNNPLLGSLINSPVTGSMA